MELNLLDDEQHTLAETKEQLKDIVSIPAKRTIHF